MLVGPSGSGKTTALRLLAGLEAITDGEIRVGERLVNRVAPQDRDIAMVFQDYALYPQMTVYDNLAFGLQDAEDPESPRSASGSSGRRGCSTSASCSSGSRARCRAGSASGSRSGEHSCASLQAFLMDEPLSNLDAKLRVQTRSEIKQLQRAGRDHDGLCHARPGRGDDDGRPRRGDERRSARAGRRHPDRLRAPGQRLRRRVHREPRDDVRDARRDAQRRAGHACPRRRLALASIRPVRRSSSPAR